jgi:glutamyl-tRNA synthetase
LHALIDVYKERSATVCELMTQIYDLHTAPTKYNEQDVAKWIDAHTHEYLKEVVKKLEELQSFSVELLTQVVKDTATQLAIKLVKIAQPIRIALVGKAASPGVFALMALLGKEKTCERIRALLHTLAE